MPEERSGSGPASPGDACAAPDLRSGDAVIPAATVHRAFLAAPGSLIADVRDTDAIIGARRA